MKSLQSLDPGRFESPAILKKLISANRRLAELKGVAASVPNQSILISTLGLQEAKESSAIENIVTTHDEVFRESAFAEGSAAAKEVARYGKALKVGFDLVRKDKLITTNHILRIQAVLDDNRSGFRKLPGTTLKDGGGQVIYTPPTPEVLPELMSDLERFMNAEPAFDGDPLVRMALMHHQFESIHPFYDGNGRTGRILNVLYLVKEGLLDLPVLYMSRAIVRSKADYYRLLQAVRERDSWEDWVLYMLDAVDLTAAEGISKISAIRQLLLEYKHRIREKFSFYSQDLINNLFSYPYTKIDFVQRELGVSRLTATRYLKALVAEGLLAERKVGRVNYYVNRKLYRILTGEQAPLQ